MNKMNKLFVVSYIVLWVLSLSFFILLVKNHFFNKTPDITTMNNSVRIAYFDMDSLQNNYQNFLTIKKELENKQNKVNMELASMENQYKNKLESLQKNYTTMTAMQQKQAQEDLLALQDNFKKRGEKLQVDLNNERNSVLMKLTKDMEDFLKPYAEAHGYSFVLMGQPGLIYYKNPAYDITADLIKGLNKQQ